MRLAPVAITAMILLTPLSGCISLDPVGVPDRLLDPASGNGWVPDPSLSSGPDGGLLSKRASVGYQDPAEEGPGYPGVLIVQSFRGLLSPDREALRDQIGELLRQEAEDQGLEVEDRGATGQRNLANGALSFYIVINATGTADSLTFTNEATVKGLGEVFRCTGGATVAVKAFAQVDSRSSIGGIPTSRDYQPRTWSEVVQDPFGSIEGFQGSRGLVHNLVCP